MLVNLSTNFDRVYLDNNPLVFQFELLGDRKGIYNKPLVR